jgi:phospholipid-binding lipoprotein MlaA
MARNRGGVIGAAYLSQIAALVVSLLAAACATAPGPADTEAYAEYQAANDPLEPLNRGVFAFNRAIDAMFLKPAAGFYRGLTPPPVQKAVTNVLGNLRSPVVFANDLMQGEVTRAGNTASRFLINSTIGVGGIVDWAADFGIPRHGEDFGQTLAVWGVPDGPFLMLPVIGPSNPRDAVGYAVDSLLIDPIAWWLRFHDQFAYLGYVRMGMTVIDYRSQNYEALEDLEKNSLDHYAALRSLYRQFRAGEINQGRQAGGEGTPLSDLPDFSDFPGADEPAPAGEAPR